MRKRYFNILYSEKSIFDIIQENDTENCDAFNIIADCVVSPVVFMYTTWIIHKAEKSGIKKIYFFSRDGYLMYHTAKFICEKRQNGIHCSYFYCSRYSLRMAAYRFKDDSAYDKLFYFAYKMSVSMLLQRADFSSEERKLVYKDINFHFDENEIIGKRKFSEICDKIKASTVFEKILLKKSNNAFDNFCLYINQESFSEYTDVAVVDLGWNGSMQYTLRKLLDSMKIKTVLHGFYLGLLSEPQSCEGSFYYSWLFNKNNFFIRSWFSHNLLECICSAPHGMTTSYIYNNNIITAVMTENENSGESVEIIKESLNKFKFLDFPEYKKTYKELARRLLFNLMVRPENEEVKALSKYCFCDDIAEQYHGELACGVKRKELVKEIFPIKLFYRDNSDGLYWYFGSAEISKVRNKYIYKSGYLITKYLISVLR